MRKMPIAGFFMFLTFSFSLPVLQAAKLSVAIMPLQNISGVKDLGHLSGTIPDSLATSLKASEDFRIIDKTKVQKAIGNISFADYSAAFKAGKQLSADIVIFGGYAVINGIIDISLEAIDVRTGKIKLSEGKRGKSDIQLFDLVDDLCSSMKKRMTKELVSDQGYITRKEEVKIEEVYIQDVKKNHGFLMGLGISSLISSANSWGPVGSFTSAGFMTGLTLGYGYGPFMLSITGTPPLLNINERGGSGYAGLKWYLKNIPLFIAAKYVFNYGHSKVISGQDIDLNFNSGFIGSIGWSINDRLSVEAGAGSLAPEANQDSYIQPYEIIRLKSPLFYLEVEWLFIKPYGISVTLTYCDIGNDLGEVYHSFQILPLFIYKMKF